MAWGNFRNLRVWVRARDLAVHVCRVTNEPSFRRDWSLRDQMRRAAVSVPSNIAEGNERRSGREAAQFLAVAKGSLAELATQLEIAQALDLIDWERSNALQGECGEIDRMLAALMAFHGG